MKAHLKLVSTVILLSAIVLGSVSSSWCKLLPNPGIPHYKPTKHKIIRSTQFKLKVSAYTNSFKETGNHTNLTANSEQAIPHKTCAVSHDLKYLLGKEVLIDGVGIRRVNDLTAKRFKNKIDLCMGSVGKAKQFGVTHKTVTVL